jgi:hypothetical protein
VAPGDRLCCRPPGLVLIAAATPGRDSLTRGYSLRPLRGSKAAALCGSNYDALHRSRAGRRHCRRENTAPPVAVFNAYKTLEDYRKGKRLGNTTTGRAYSTAGICTYEDQRSVSNLRLGHFPEISRMRRSSSAFNPGFSCRQRWKSC